MGGAKKTTVGYKYYATFQMILARSIESISRITIGDVLAWTGNQKGDGVVHINEPELFGGKAREGGIVADINFQPGYPTQQADAFLQEQIGTPIPAARGVAGIVCRNGYLGNNPYMKDWKIRAQRIHILDDGSPQWYDETSAIENTAMFIPSSYSNWKYKIVQYTDTNDYSSTDDSNWLVGSAPFGSPNFQGNPASYPHDFGFEDVPATLTQVDQILWLHTEFTIADAVSDTMQLEVYIDNFLDMWVNGVKVVNHLVPDAFHAVITLPGSAFVVGSNAIAFRCYDAEPTNTVPGNRSYFDLRVKDTVHSTYDMNPAHMTREGLLNNEWGYCYTEADIDDDNFRAAADLFYSESLGLSYMWDDQSVELDDIMEKIQTTADFNLYVDRTTLKWTIDPVRGGYDPAALPLFVAGVEIQSIDDFTIPVFSELVNKVVVQFYDVAVSGTGSVSVPNPALRLQQGFDVVSQKQYDMVHNKLLASRLGERDLHTEGAPLRKGTLVLLPGVETNKLRRGSLCRVTFPLYGLNNTVVRATFVTRGDGKTRVIKMGFVEDKFSLPDTAVVPSQPNVWIDPNGAAKPLVNRLLIEAPYFYLLRQIGATTLQDTFSADPTVGYLGMAAARVPASLNAGLWVDAGAGYVEGGTLDFGPYGVLAAPIAELDTTFTLSATLDMAELDFPTVLQIDQELLQVAAYDATTNVASGVKRGLYDTLPARHLAGASVFLFEDYLDGDSIQYEQGETINVKLLTNASSSALPLAQAPVDTLTFDARAIRPYAPGHLLIDGASPYTNPSTALALGLTWAHRDRLTQSDVAIDNSEASVGPEAGTTYNVRVRGALSGDIVFEVTGLTDATYTVVNNFAFGDYLLELESERDGYVSWQHYSIPFSVPGGYFATEDGLGHYLTDDESGYYTQG